jgi:hypothetical protein
MASEVTFWVLSVKDSATTYSLHKFSATGELLETVDTEIIPGGIHNPKICAQNDIVIFGDNHNLHAVLGDRTVSSHEWCDPETYTEAKIVRIIINNGAFSALCLQYFYDNETYLESSDGINWTLSPLFENTPERSIADIRWFSPDNKYAILYTNPAGETVYGYYRFTSDFIVYSDPTDHPTGRTFGTFSGELQNIFTVGSKFYAPSYDEFGAEPNSPAILTQTGYNGVESVLPINPAEHRPADGVSGHVFYDIADGAITAAFYDEGLTNYKLFKLSGDGTAFEYSGSASDQQAAQILAAYSTPFPYLITSTTGRVGLGITEGSTPAGVTASDIIALLLPEGYTATNVACMDAQDVSLFWTENIRTREYL